MPQILDPCRQRFSMVLKGRLNIFSLNRNIKSFIVIGPGTRGVESGVNGLFSIIFTPNAHSQETIYRINLSSNLSDELFAFCKHLFMPFSFFMPIFLSHDQTIYNAR